MLAQSSNEYGEKDPSVEIGAPDASASTLRERLEIARSSLNSEADKAKDGLLGNNNASDNSFSATTRSNDETMDLNLRRIKSSLDESAGDAKAQLTSAQQDFQEAMSSAVDQSKGQVSNAFDQSNYQVNSSLYDANGRLKSAADTANNTTGALADQFQNRVGNMQQQANDFAAGAATSTRDRISNLSKTASDAINQPFPKFESGTTDSNEMRSLQALQAEIAEGRRQVEALRQQVNADKAAKAAGTSPGFADAQLQPLAQSKQPLANRSANNSLQPLKTANSAMVGNSKSNNSLMPITQPQGNSQAKSSSTSSNSFSPGGALSQLQPIQGNQEFGSTPANSTSEKTVYGNLTPNSDPANSASGNSFQPQSTSPDNGQFPSTPHNNFSRRGNSQPSIEDLKVHLPGASSASSNVRQVGFESGASSSGVRQADALQPIEASGMHQAARIDTHVIEGRGLSNVSEVELPAAILTGDGSYAPGSVNRLKR